MARHIRRGWFKNETGELFFQLRYGAKPIELEKGLSAIAKLDAIPATIDLLIKAIETGELDTVLTSAAIERRKNFKRKTAAAA